METSFIIDKSDLNKIGMGILDVLVHVGFAKTKNEARRLIRGGAIKIDDKKITSEEARVIFKDDCFLLLTPEEKNKI